MSNHNCVNKILKSIYREWQPKITIIKESHDLKTLDMSTLFGKLDEHEHESKRLKASESITNIKDKNKDYKKKISKTSTSKAKVKED